MTHSSVLSDLIDLNSALTLSSEQEIGLDRKKQRDRQIGQTFQQYRHKPGRQIRGWLGQVEIREWPRDGGSAARFYQVLCLSLVIAGILAGWGLTRAVLHYTGDEPINIIHTLGLLVVPQVILLLFWVLSLLPVRILFLDTLLSALRLLNPGRLTHYLADRLPGKNRHGLSVLWNTENQTVLAPAARWLFSFWSQLFAFSFNTGVLLAAFYMISFSDLAFAWSTTLDLDSAMFHEILGTVSWPWHTLFPEAVPSAELVELSRYYRLEDVSLGNGPLSPEIATQLGQWWPFLLAAIACYGLFPRLLTLLISWSRFHHHLLLALPRLPGAPELLARMNSPLVSTSAQQPETAAGFDTNAIGGKSKSSGYGLNCALVSWSGAINNADDIAGQLQTLGIRVQGLLPAGGTRSTDQDGNTIVSLCGSRPEGVAVVVKAWEPPLLEFLDFVQSIRRKCHKRQPVIVLLWGGSEAVSDINLETWQVMLQQLKDPDLYTEPLGPTP